METTMPPTNLFSRLLLIFILSISLTVSGCSYIPWMGDEEEEETIGFDDEIPFEEPDNEMSNVSEDDFFGEEPSGGSDGFDEGLNDGFASIDQPTDSGEMKVDLENLQDQQEALNAKVRELQEIISALEPKISATQEQLQGNLGNISQKADFLEPEVNELKLQMAQLKEELAMVKMKSRSGSHRMKSSHSSRGGMHKKMGSGVSHSFKMKYDQALSSYRGGQFDESILLFQNLAVMNPPMSYQDNIHYWIGSNFVKLEMFDDAIKHFETVLDKFPRGNKVHDSRFMLGVSYHKKGESSRAIDILQSALRSNPTAEVRAKIEKELSQIQ